MSSFLDPSAVFFSIKNQAASHKNNEKFPLIIHILKACFYRAHANPILLVFVFIFLHFGLIYWKNLLCNIKDFNFVFFLIIQFFWR